MAKKITAERVKAAEAKAQKMAAAQTSVSQDTMPDGGIKIGGVNVRAFSGFDMMFMTKIAQMKDITDESAAIAMAYALCTSNVGKLWRMLDKPANVLNAAVEWSATIPFKSFADILEFVGEQREAFESVVVADEPAEGGGEGN